MSRWQCPNCGNNRSIIERLICAVEWTGKFEDQGGTGFTHVADATSSFAPEVAETVDGFEAQYYCNDCDNWFDFPEEVEDEET